ncbi:MAG: MATE family efflux transporter [Anaerotignaceae bacterium]
MLDAKIMDKKERAIDMTQGDIWKQLILFSVPLLISNLLQQFYNTADVLIVGKFVGNTALAAVGSCSVLVSALTLFFIGISAGANVCAATAFGMGKYKKLRQVVHTTAAISIISGLLLTILGVFFSPVLLRWMNTPQEVMDLAVLYSKIYFFGMIPMMIYNMGSGLLTAWGDSKTPLYFLAGSGIGNVLLDMLFVVVLKTGVGGAAIATVFTQVVLAILMVRKLMKADKAYSLAFIDFGADKTTFFEIIRIGIPAGLQSVLVSFSNIIVQSNVNLFGVSAMAGFAAFNKIDGFMFMPIGAFVNAIASFTGQNHGAQKPQRIAEGRLKCFIMCGGLTVAMSLIFIVLGSHILGMFTDDPEAIAFGVTEIKYQLPLYFIYSINQVQIGVMRGKGIVFVPMVITLLCMCGLRIVWICTVLTYFKDPRVIFLSYPLTWIVTNLVFGIYQWRLKKRE